MPEMTELEAIKLTAAALESAHREAIDELYGLRLALRELAQGWRRREAVTKNYASQLAADELDAVLTQTRPQPKPAPATDKPKCWLCLDDGGIALHHRASAVWAHQLWVAHRLESDTHPVYPCPRCAFTELLGHFNDLNRSFAELGERFMKQVHSS